MSADSELKCDAPGHPGRVGFDLAEARGRRKRKHERKGNCKKDLAKPYEPTAAERGILERHLDRLNEKRPRRS